ncbi:hypothetical protein ACX1C1_21390 [Paenibacillus sp. strain BS8-2]
MDIQMIFALIAVAGTLSGLWLGWTGKSRTVKQDTAAEVAQDITIKSDMEYLKRGVDDIRFEQRTQGQRIDAMSERLTRVEESTKSAHRRIDRVEAKGD